MTLDKGKLNTSYSIKKVDENLTDITRLSQLGLIEGNIVKIILVSPFLDIFIIDVNNYLLALRKNTLSFIEIEEFPC